jgi:hypothetical protein
MNKSSLFFMLLSMLVPLPPAYAQHTPGLSAAAVMNESAATATSTNDPSAIVMIENRARVLANRASAGGTRYFEVRSSDLAGKTPDQVIQRLSPSVISQGEFVRKVELVVDLQRPLTIVTNGSQPVNIGTASFQGNVANVEVHANIISSDITIISKK